MILDTKFLKYSLPDTSCPSHWPGLLSSKDGSYKSYRIFTNKQVSKSLELCSASSDNLCFFYFSLFSPLLTWCVLSSSFLTWSMCCRSTWWCSRWSLGWGWCWMEEEQFHLPQNRKSRAYSWQTSILYQLFPELYSFNLFNRNWLGLNIWLLFQFPRHDQLGQGVGFKLSFHNENSKNLIQPRLLSFEGKKWNIINKISPCQ